MSFAAAFWLPARDAVASAEPRMSDVRALTIRQPWAACIASGEKTVENRTRLTRYRGTLAIHAGANFDDLEAHPLSHTPYGGVVMDTYFRAPEELMVHAAVLALADLIDCHRYEPGCCDSRWAEKSDGVWHWTLGEIRTLSRPVPCRGQLGLWRLPQDVLTEVAAQLDGAL